MDSHQKYLNRKYELTSYCYSLLKILKNSHNKYEYYINYIYITYT